jgi:hypothetical protein
MQGVTKGVVVIHMVGVISEEEGGCFRVWVGRCGEGLRRWWYTCALR